jgi:PAT family beta-lactamase induction signal transducer AmpG
MLSGLKQSFNIYLHPKIIGITFLGFVSGLPFPLTFATLSFWFAEVGVSKSSIGLFALVGTPFVIKFLWAPLVDQLSIPFLTKKFGQRRGWIITAQIALMVSLLLLGMGDPLKDLWGMALLAIIVSTCAATQDIGIDAFRIEAIEENQQGAGAAAIVFGWRIGALVSGAGSLFIAASFGWFVAYCAMAALMLIGTVTVLLLKEPNAPKNYRSKNWKDWIRRAVLEPFTEFMNRKGWLVILLFILVYKMGDAIALSMLSPFAVDLGFSKTEYASIVKIYGTVATLAGAFAGGAVMYRFGIIKGLWICGILQMCSTLAFVWQAQVGYDLTALTITISLENFASGMGTTAFVAYISALCNAGFTATQYALFSAFAAMGRTWFAGASGYMVDYMGWSQFFLTCVALALPGLLLLWWITAKYKE